MHPVQSFSQAYVPSYPSQASSYGQQYATLHSGSGQYGQSYGSQMTQQQGPSMTTSASGSGQVTFSQPAPSAHVYRTLTPTNTLNTPLVSPRDANTVVDSSSRVSPMTEAMSFIADDTFAPSGGDKLSLYYFIAISFNPPHYIFHGSPQDFTCLSLGQSIYNCH